MSVLMLFLDGVGIGRLDASTNPFFAAHLPSLRWLLGGDLPSLHHQEISSPRAKLLPLDATLGVAGLPQSGTGQTALFTGLNAAKLIGKHFGPYPYSTLRPVIEEHNVFRQLIKIQRTSYFANAFPQRFFDYVSQHRSRLTVTTLSCLTSGMPLLKSEDLFAGDAVSADITNRGWAELGYPTLAPIEPAEAGRRLARLAGRFDFVLFEYWKTDYAGHSRSMESAIEVLELFDGMLEGILNSLDTRRSLLFITSDHGNLEDLSIKSHTRHPVPAILYGHRHEGVSAALHRTQRGPASLVSVTPVLVDYLSTTPSHHTR